MSDSDDVFNSEAASGSDKSSPRHVYTREELVELSELPLSRKRPDHLLDDYENEDGVWDPEIWHKYSDAGSYSKLKSPIGE